MKIGKISENVWKRSVLKYVKKNHEESGAALLNGCALLSCQTVTFPVTETLIMRRAVYAAINDILAQDGIPQKMTIAITCPERMRESKLAQMMEEAQTICNRYDIAIIGGHTMVSDSVNDPVVTITVMGQKIEKEQIDVVPGDDIVCIGYIGMDGASLIAHAREKELLQRFPKTMVSSALDFEKTLAISDDVACIKKEPVGLMQTVREGGIFAALWELSKKSKAGLSVDIKKIPMKQMVVEICNLYDLNPYEMISTGCLLVVVKDGDALVNTLESVNRKAAVIGKLIEGNDKIIVNADEVRYLDLPKPDQIRKLLSHAEQMAWVVSTGEQESQKI